MLDRYELSDGQLLGSMTDNASSNCFISHELQSTLQGSSIEWPALRNHIPCIAHSIQLTVGAFMFSLGVKCCTRCWEAHQCHLQFEENKSIDVGKSQRHRKEGNARINKISAMRPELAKRIEKVHNLWYFESSEIDCHLIVNACCSIYTDTWSSKQVHWLSFSQSTHRCTSDYGCEDTLELRIGVTQGCLPITGLHGWLTPKSKTQRLPATLHITRWMDDCHVGHEGLVAISSFDPVDVEET